MKVLSWLPAAGLAARLAAGDSSPDSVAGEALAQRLRSVRPERASTNQAVLKLRGPGGRKSVPLTVETRPTPSGWEVRYEARPEGLPAESLTILHATNAPPQYRVGTESSPGAAEARFAGSDFSRLDLGLEFLHWPQQRLLRRELSNGRTCEVLESQPAETAPYGSVRSWVDAEHGVILSAEAYDAKKVRLKQFSVTNFREVADQWTFSLSIVDDRRGSKTELSYETAPQR
jgi:hypothetical protein